MSTRSEKMPKTQNEQKDRDTEVVLDLTSFVTEVERFSSLVEPFAFFFYAVDDIRRWRFPNATIAFWVLANICCFVLTQGAVFILASCLVIAIATVCLCQLHTRVLDKYLPKTKPEQNNRNSAEEANTLDTIQNFQYSLIQMHDFVVKSNEYLTYFYAVLKWDDTVPAIIYYTEVCVTMLCLVVFPVRWNWFLFINWFFLCHPNMIKTGYKCWTDFVESFNRTKEQSTASPTCISVAPDAGVPQQAAAGSSANPAQNSELSKSRAVEDLDGIEGEDKDDSSDIDLIEMSNMVDESLTKLEPSPTRPGMVARLLELKRRRSQMTNENCFGCRVSFTSILKRRHYCRHCGNSFCHKCCNLKVPRSVFGATSPAASKETVLVCNNCHALLTGPADGATTQVQKNSGDAS